MIIVEFRQRMFGVTKSHERCMALWRIYLAGTESEPSRMPFPDCSQKRAPSLLHQLVVKFQFLNQGHFPQFLLYHRNSFCSSISHRCVVEQHQSAFVPAFGSSLHIYTEAQLRLSRALTEMH